jgi:hypothetical protein
VSTSFNGTNIEVQTGFGLGSVGGVEIADQVWLTPEISVNNITMIGVTYVKNLNFIKADGVIGLARDDAGVNPFLKALKDANVIKNMTFGISYHHVNETSTMTIGDIPLHVNKNGIAWSDIDSQYSWSIKLQHMIFGTLEEKKPVARRLVFMNEVNHIIMPMTDYNTWFDVVS